MAKTSSLVSKVPAITDFIKQSNEEMKKEIEGIREIVTELSAPEIEKVLLEDGKKCAAAKVETPVDCYILIYGSVTSVIRGGSSDKHNSEGGS